MRRIDRLISTIAGSVNWLVIIALGLLIVHVTIDVVCRAFLNLPLSGTILAVSLFYMPMIAFVPLAFTETRGAHITVEILYDMLPKALQRLSDGLAHVLSILVFSALAWRTWGEAMSKYGIGSSEMEGSLRIPTWPSYFFLPLGFALIITVVVWRLVCLLAQREPDFQKDAAKEELTGV